MQEHSVPEVEYAFQHVLTQQTVYDNIVSTARTVLHQKTAAAIEALDHDNLSAYYEQLAYHYDRGNNAEKAVVYLVKAGEQAFGRSAFATVVAHLTRALQLLSALPAGPQRSRTELDILMALCPPVLISKGQSSAELLAYAGQAHELAVQLDDKNAQFDALIYLWAYQYHCGHIVEACALGEQVMVIAQTTGVPRQLVEAHHLMNNDCAGAGRPCARPIAHRTRAGAGCIRRGWLAVCDQRVTGLFAEPGSF